MARITSVLEVTASKPRPVESGLWKHGLLIVVLLGFSALILGGFAVFRSAAPVPEVVATADGTQLFSSASIKGGQATYQKYGLMDYGSVLGHGAYLGPDYTAETINLTTTHMRDYTAQQRYGAPYAQLPAEEQVVVADLVKKDLRQNRYDAATGTLTLTPAQAYAYEKVREHYRAVFTEGDVERALQPGLISEAHVPANGRAWVAPGDQIDQISSFFFWTAWLATTNRPGLNYSYTNNWPFDAAAGNTSTLGSLFWSAASVAILLLLMGVLVYVYQRYRLRMEEAYEKMPLFNAGAMPVTPSQRATAKFFVVAVVLLLTQSLLGALLAHYYVEGSSFYGFDILAWLPFNVARAWHLQLAVFWIATAWLALGIYIAPLVSGREPRYQKTLVNILFVALVVVVFGSMAGEWLGVQGRLGNLWWLLGYQGWEYLELGRVWQALLMVGLGIWLFIVYRGVATGLRREHDKGGLTHLLVYSAVSIPFFYGFGFFFDPSTHITMADYWRWWVIHLWVEGMFEVFAVVVIGFLLVRLGLLTHRSTLRALYFQLMILLGTGIVGTGHHYYWIGAPEAWIALGAVFSALEVIPLTLLLVEAHGQYRVATQGGKTFPYRGTFWFLTAVAFWNLFGAGVLGFFINLPFVSYFEHGSFLTAAHGHAALAGVYGMLGIALLLFGMRNLVRPDKWNDRLIKISFWGLNIGLMGMVMLTLVPVGVAQLGESFTNGFWSARSLEFYRTPLVYTLLWVRMLPDSIFIVFGVVPLALAMVRGLLHLRPVTVKEEEIAELKTEKVTASGWLGMEDTTA
ncbi:MAG: cbb3-type cytochrome c oxidase subunit I [Dehalococcoidales bacterium]|nr:cbb3-type cytochrome c oxidase subunit I [Dehalococcoidales bacterium]